jgi:hypothetical protein
MVSFGVFVFLGSIFLLLGLGVLYMGIVVKELMPFLFGLVFAGIGVGLLVPCIRHLTKKRKAKSGRLVRASIIGYECNYRVKVNRRHPYFFTCEGEGRSFIFETLRYGNPDAMLGKTVDVYVSDVDSNVYYVDDKSLL